MMKPLLQKLSKTKLSAFIPCAITTLFIAVLVIVFAALSISFGGTFAFVLGIIFAVLCGLGMIIHFIGAAEGALANGFFSIYNLVMMILFIVALAL